MVLDRLVALAADHHPGDARFGYAVLAHLAIQFLKLQILGTEPREKHRGLFRCPTFRRQPHQLGNRSRRAPQIDRHRSLRVGDRDPKSTDVVTRVALEVERDLEQRPT